MRDEIKTAVQALERLGEEHGAFADPQRLSRDDLFFLADLPLTHDFARFDREKLDEPARERLARLLGLGSPSMACP